MLWVAALLPMVAHTGPSNANLDAYTKFQEFHFELRMKDDQRSRYQGLLRDDYAAGRLRGDVNQASETVQKWARGDFLTIASTHSEMKRVDDIELSTEEMLNNGTIHGSGIYAQTRREARSGCLSSKFLLDVVSQARRPMRGDGNIYRSLFPRHLDATFEWTAVRMVFVAGRKVWDGSEANRSTVHQGLLKAWDAAKNDQERSALLDALNSNVLEWTVWRIADYQHFTRLSPFQQKGQLVLWGHDLLPFVPSLKPEIDKRTQEFAQYVRKMPDSEIRAEYDRLQKSNARFKAYLERSQSEMNSAQATATAMQNAMRDFHVANLNVAENMGNSGYRWVLAP